MFASSLKEKPVPVDQALTSIHIPFEKDFKLILNVLEDQEVFLDKCSRKHHSFDFQTMLIQQVPYTALVKWIRVTTMALVNSL